MFGPTFGSDVINGFDANAGGGGQDLLNIGQAGITDTTSFNAKVTIQDLGADTLVTIAGVGSITLTGVNGVGSNSITIDDFRFV